MRSHREPHAEFYIMTAVAVAVVVLLVALKVSNWRECRRHHGYLYCATSTR